MSLGPVIPLVACLLAAVPALGQETPLALPEGTVETARIVEDPGSVRLPIGPHSADAAPGIPLDGRVLVRAWRIPPEHGDPGSVIRALRPQLEAAGFTVLFECVAQDCGGFDFRFANRVLPAPAVEFDLTDFRALTARRTDGHIGLILTRSARAGFVQAIEVTPGEPDLPALYPPRPLLDEVLPETVEGASVGLARQLESEGRAVLDGVSFASGALGLAADAIAALEPLAQALRDAPGLSVILVGHTDNEGGLAANIEVSRLRAEAVRKALIDSYGIAPARLSAEGAGFLSPRASNATPEGRASNRRVEVIPR